MVVIGQRHADKEHGNSDVGTPFRFDPDITMNPRIISNSFRRIENHLYGMAPEVKSLEFYVSPYLRTRKTFSYMCPTRPSSSQWCLKACEWINPERYHPKKEDFREDSWAYFGNDFPPMESGTSFEARIRDLVDTVIRPAASDPTTCLYFVTHGMVIKRIVEFMTDGVCEDLYPKCLEAVVFHNSSVVYLDRPFLQGYEASKVIYSEEANRFYESILTKSKEPVWILP